MGDKDFPGQKPDLFDDDLGDSLETMRGIGLSGDALPANQHANKEFLRKLGTAPMNELMRGKRP